MRLQALSILAEETFEREVRSEKYRFPPKPESLNSNKDP